MSKVAKAAEAISKRMAAKGYKTSGGVILPFLIKILQCIMDRAKPAPPTPPTSLEIQTEEEREAWATACAAVDEVSTDYAENNNAYSKRLIRRTAKQVKHDKKREDGTKPTPDEVAALTLEILDHTRTSTPAEIYPAALEAQA